MGREKGEVGKKVCRLHDQGRLRGKNDLASCILKPSVLGARACNSLRGSHWKLLLR